MPTQDPSLETIIRNLRAGNDEEANSRLLFVRFYPEVCGYFRRRGVAVEDSEDLAQEVFWQVFRRLDSLRDDAHFPGWLFIITRNVFNNEISRRHASKRAAAVVSQPGDNGGRDLLETIESRSPAASMLKGVLNKEKVSALLLELRKLPAQMQRCICLRVIHEYSDDQIATLLGISSNTVRVHVFRAKKALSDALRPMFGDLRI
jgi:RNA polymerase sigma-70 factor, ECF subfamily